MKVVGLDLSLTSSGVAAIEDGGLVAFHVVKPGDRRREAERLAFVVDQVLNFVCGKVGWVTAHGVPDGVDLWAIEGYSYNSRTTQAHSTGELGGVLRYVLYRAGGRYVVIPPATWRKDVLGRGSLDKVHVALEVFKRYGVEFKSDDAMEAFCVAQAAYLQATGQTKPKITRRRAA